MRVPVTKKKDWTLNLNQYRNTHYQTLNKAKVVYKELIKDQLLGFICVHPITIEYTLFVKTQRRMDIGNVLSVHQKFFEDALVELSCIPDDDYHWIPQVVFSYGGQDKDNPRVEITIQV